MTPDQASGILAATFAPFSMALGFILWDKTWKTYHGSAFGLNLFKCTVASIGFTILCLSVGWYSTSASAVLNDPSAPKIFSGRNVGFLILSAILGIIIGDSAWLEALRLMGATRVLIVDTIKPFAAAALGRILLHEHVQNIAYLGIVCTTVGVLVVGLDKELERRQEGIENTKTSQQLDEQIVSETADALGHDGNCLYDETLIKQQKSISDGSLGGKTSSQSRNEVSMQNVTRGYTFALINVLFDTYGSLLTKQHGQYMAPWAISLIRFGSSGAIMILMSIGMRLRYKTVKPAELEFPPLSSEFSQGTAAPPWYILPTLPYRPWVVICLGVVLVTFTCPLLNNYALFRIALALAITLGSITPLYALFLEWPLKGIRPTVKATLGCLLAVCGVCILAVWGS